MKVRAKATSAPTAKAPPAVDTEGRCARATREAKVVVTRDDGAVLRETPTGFVDNEPFRESIDSAIERGEAMVRREMRRQPEDVAEIIQLRARLATYSHLVRACEFAALAKMAMEEE